MNFDQANLLSINRLNQRGGRMLSICDLIKAGTLSLELASELILIIYHNGSYLTAAGPGGVGKTTLMAALLAFLPRETEIITIPGSGSIRQFESGRSRHHRYFMVHEIGAGPYFSYLWGNAVAAYFGLIAENRSIVSNLHAETYDSAVSQLSGHPLSVSPESIANIGFFAFMKQASCGKRVTEVWYAQEAGRHIQAWTWDKKSDSFHYIAPIPFPGLFSGILRQNADILEQQLSCVKNFLKQALEKEIFLLEGLRKLFVRDCVPELV